LQALAILMIDKAQCRKKEVCYKQITIYHFHGIVSPNTWIFVSEKVLHVRIT